MRSNLLENVFFVLRTGMFLPRDASVLVRPAKYRAKKKNRKKNDELQIQHHQCNISLSRSLHIVVHNHWYDRERESILEKEILQTTKTCSIFLM